MLKTQVIGYLGRDCNVNSVNGKNVINFSVAHTEKFKDAAGVQREKTTWVNCSWWVERTAVAQYLVKGQLVYVDGQPEVHSYQAQDRSWRADLKLRVSTLQLLGGNNQKPNNAQPGSSSEPANTGYTTLSTEFEDEPLPF